MTRMRMIQSRRMSWAGHVACVKGDVINAYTVLVRKPKER
jgi:hypothetical protein